MAAAESLGAHEPLLIEFSRLEFEPQSVIVLVFRERHQPVILLRWIPDGALRQTFDKSYTEIGHLLDPFAQRAAIEPFRSTFRIFEIAPDRFESSEYYATYYRRTGMVDELGALQRLDDNSVLHLSLGRNAGYPKFTARETRKFRMLSVAIMPKLAKLAGSDTARGTSPPTRRDLVEIFRNLPAGDHCALSRREAQVAALITQGHSSRAISLNLGISIHTVKVHRRNLYKKLSISAQNELFGLAMAARNRP